MLISELNVSFDILAITESGNKKDSSSPINLQLNNCSTEHTSTESSAGGTFLYISKILSYQLKNNLKLKTSSTEIICSKSTDVIVGSI